MLCAWEFLNTLELGLAGYETVVSITAIIALKQPVNGPEISAAVQPTIAGLQAAFGVVIPAPLVVDVSATAADAINRYVLKLK